MVTVMIKPERLVKINQMVEESKLPTQKAMRTAIKDRLFAYIDDAEDENDLYAKLWLDFPVWCVAFIDDDQSKPLFVAKWQVEFQSVTVAHDYVWTLCSRKIGKSTILACIIAHIMCGPNKERIVVFAPTHGQDFVYKKCRTYLMANAYLNDTFFKDNGGNSTGSEMVSANGCQLINRSISITTGGSTIRGEYGSVIVVDEIQEIDQQIMDTIVFPMIADAYSRKRLIMLGTPNLYRNPDLETRYNNWKENSAVDPSYAYFTVDAWRGITEGCVSEKWVQDQKKELPPDDFAMEYLAQFPDTSMRYYPLVILDAMVDRRLSFINAPRPGKKYIMAVDWAKFYNLTEILVGEVDVNKSGKAMCTYANYHCFDPKVRKVDYEEQTDFVADWFNHYDCCWICPDATSTQDAIIEMLKKKINPHKIYGYNKDLPFDKQVLGFKGSASLNFEMHKNHKQQISTGRIKMPGGGVKEEKFVLKYQRQHHELQAIAIQNNSLIKLAEPKGGAKDLAVTAGMLSMYLKGLDKPKASFAVK